MAAMFEHHRQKEKSRRQKFLESYSQHFILSLFPSFTDRIPRLMVRHHISNHPFNHSFILSFIVPSNHLSIYLSIHLSIYLSIYPSIYLVPTYQPT